MGYRVRRLLGTLARLECLVFFPLVTQLALETCPLLRVLPGVCNVKCFCSENMTFFVHTCSGSIFCLIPTNSKGCFQGPMSSKPKNL